MNNNDDSEILDKFVHSVPNEVKILKSDIFRLVDKHFWDLV